LGAVLSHLPRVIVDEGGRVDIGHGRPIPGVVLGTAVLVFENEVIAVAEGDGTWLKPTVVLAAP
jgi:hypothetical protein